MNDNPVKWRNDKLNGGNGNIVMERLVNQKLLDKQKAVPKFDTALNYYITYCSKYTQGYMPMAC